jgi:hypothetical protein
MGGVCVLHCPLHYKEDNQGRLCVYDSKSDKELIATMNVTANNSLELGFSSPLRAALSLSAIDLSLFDSENNPQNFTYDMQETRFNQFYEIFIHFRAINGLSTALNVLLTFLNTSSISDSYNNTLKTQHLYGKMNLLPNISMNIQTTSGLSSSGTTTAEATLVSSLCSSIISANPNTFLTIINNIQMLGYLPLSGINMTQEVRNLLKSLNMQSFLPNPVLWVIDEEEAGNPPYFAQQYGYSSPLFLANMGIMFSFGVLIACLNIVFWLLTKAPKCLCASILIKLTEKYSWNPLLQYWIQVYLDASIASYLQLYRLAGNTANLAVNAVLAVTIALLAVISPAAGLWMVIKLGNKGEKGDIKHWKALFSSFRNDRGVRSSLFYPVFLARRLFYSSVLITCFNYPKFQSISFISHSLVVSFHTDSDIFALLFPF